MKAILLLAPLALAGCMGTFMEDAAKTPAQRCAEAAEAYDQSGHTILDGALVVVACAG
jgi:hypothetical protein